MTHPEHGTTFAVGAEVEWNKKYGWKIDEEPKEEPKVVAPTPPVPKRGRPRKV
jgi:hypothetical protein